MREDNAFTTPEQRFFMPVMMEAEHHESFHTANTPNVEIMDGSVAYIITEDAKGTQTAYLGEKNKPLRSGSVVKKVTTTDAIPHDEPGMPVIDEEDPAMRLFDEPADSYEPQEGDLLMLQVSRDYLPKDSPLRDRMNIDGVMFLPAGEELPYLDEEKGEATNFNLMGIVKAGDRQLLTWESGHGYETQRAVDISVINANVGNSLEAALLADRMEHVGNNYLKGHLRVTPAAYAYLEYFESAPEPENKYLPTETEEEPRNKPREFGPMTPDQKRRYDLVAKAIVAATHQ